MSARRSSLLAWSLLAISVALIGAAIVLEGLNHRLSGGDAANGYSAVLVVLTFAGVGALVASREPSNPIGCLFCLVGLLQALNMFGDGYSRYAVVTHPGSLPAAEVVAWVKEWCWIPSLAALPFLLLLFPDGRLPSPRWRRVAWPTAVAIALVVASAAADMWPDRHQIALGGESDRGPATLTDVLVGLGGAGILLGAIASVVALVVRLRRSRGVERLQLKWFALAGAFMVACVASAFLPAGLIPEQLTDAGLLSIPLATGIAIMRHRLFDIDVVINRALVYGSLTVALGAAYLALVLLVGLAVSTLAVSSLFRPARAYIQCAVDRRFYRRRYDAARTLEAFGGRLRDEIDLEALGADLAGVVREMVQPAHVSLCLRSGR
jgi:hypothetical protein